MSSPENQLPARFAAPYAAVLHGYLVEPGDVRGMADRVLELLAHPDVAVRMGQKGDNNRESARAKTIAFKNDDKKPSPIPLETCPWCGEKFKTTSFNLVPTADNPTDLHIVCMNRNCDFKGDRHLPIVAVDEPLYRRIPCFLIATVDKFANLPWVGQCGALW